MTKLLEDREITDSLSGILGWIRQGNSISKKYTLKNFKEALAFVNRAGELAEEMNHHPDILIHGYRFVTLTLMTHDAGGLTQKDFNLARRIETIWKDLENLTT